jgi:M3 family oligoendopeptidase
MQFQDFPYKRPNLTSISKKFDAAILAFSEAKTPVSAKSKLLKINALRAEFDSMLNLSHIRHSMDTRDVFYEKENNFFDENTPRFEELTTRFYKALLASPHRTILEKKLGSHLFVTADLLTKTFRPEILEDLQKENALGSEYDKIKAQAEIEFDGKKYNLATIHPLEIAANRDQRQRASAAKWGYYAANSAKMEQIFDDLVKTRHRIALKLGYKNFVELGYARMQRSDYDAAKVAIFRKQIQDFVVPIAQKLYGRQQQRLGLDAFKFFDEEFKYPSGNPKPQGSPDWIVENASKMYAELSQETGAFFEEMRETGLLDLINRDGKQMGGYCTYVPKFRAPFIFSNFNGTSHDIDVLTHEAGHAFQVWSSRDFDINEYHWPTYEACEIHSMSMEFFTWPWMQLFFEGDTDKYKFAHLGGAIQFLPYGVAVDEFQHIIYENPEMTPAERNTAWRSLELKYLPHRQYDQISFLENGGFWQKQGHIFGTPFYYIDYCLAQICAFQFWKRDRENHAAAWADYVTLCRAGGSQSFLKLVKLAGLRSPFDAGCVESVVGDIENWLDSVDDSAF